MIHTETQYTFRLPTEQVEFVPSFTTQWGAEYMETETGILRRASYWGECGRNRFFAKIVFDSEKDFNTFLRKNRVCVHPRNDRPEFSNYVCIKGPHRSVFATIKNKITLQTEKQ